ncbi:MAG: HAD-IB family phosphatase [Bdellovibrionales bacterium]|nr:HAD-IB family phosphatase [Bdellovibrionales bacterium]
MTTVIIPTLNEEKRIGDIVQFCLASNLVNEVIVIDDGSTDKTVEKAQQNNAKVFLSSMLGKGTSMRDGLWRAQNDVILYLDGDIYNFSNNIIELMIQPILENKSDFVKGRFHRTAGRVTALTARPMLKAFFPEIAKIEQPLGGIIAAKKELLKNIYFEPDYGVDIGLLIDIWQLGGRIQEVDIGFVEHNQQSLHQLSHMSTQIVRVILERASRYKKLDSVHLENSFEIQRTQFLQMEVILNRIQPNKKLALFDMDGTLIEGRYIERLARFANRSDQLKKLLDNQEMNSTDRTKRIAKILTGITKSDFEKIAHIVPLAEEAQNVVIELKKRGYVVGIITDSYFVAAEIIKKRIFADFSIAHLLDFKHGLFTGELEISPMMQSNLCKIHDYCKMNLLAHLLKFQRSIPENIRFAGDGLNDICLLKRVPNSFAINPKEDRVSKSATHSTDSLAKVLDVWR